MKKLSKLKYEHVVDILLAARPGDTPHDLAAEVRRRYPVGIYDPVRICEDIGHIIRRDGRFRPENVRLSSAKMAHIIAIRGRMKADGAWLTRRSRGAYARRPRATE